MILARGAESGCRFLGATRHDQDGRDSRGRIRRRTGRYIFKTNHGECHSATVLFAMLSYKDTGTVHYTVVQYEGGIRVAGAELELCIMYCRVLSLVSFMFHVATFMFACE